MKPSPMLEEIITAVLNDVMELPDRTSPDDWPEACLVTGEELDAILRERLQALISAQPGVSPGGEGVMREYLYRFMWDRVYRWVNDLQVKRDIEEAVSVLHKEFIILPRPDSPDPAEREGK